VILIPQSREVESEEEEEDEATKGPPIMEDRPARRSESPTAKGQRELVQKTTEDALRRGLEAQWMPMLNRPRFLRPKPHVGTGKDAYVE
jgi:hypothetical protein